jgi:predicted Zn-dependent peptidase
MQVEEGELSNGLRYVHQHVNHSQLSHIGLIIDVGSRDETAEERGAAHFLEHVLFKGTKSKSTRTILNRIENVGGDLNAFTTKEETVVYVSLMKDYTAKAMELISDIVFNSIFPEDEIEKERAVIVDEILSYQDSPSEIIYEEFETLYLGDHPLAADILGTVEDVQRLSRNQILNFVKKHYVPERMVLSYAGGMPFDKFEKLVQRYFGEFNLSSNYERKLLAFKPLIFQKKLAKSAHQHHTVIGSQASGLNDDQRLLMSFLNNYIGGPAMNSKLNMEVREKHGITYNIESNYAPYRELGLFHIYFGTDAESTAKAKRLVMKVLNQLRTKKLGSLQLHHAKQQFKGYLAMNMENVNGLMMSIGKTKLLYDEVETVEQVISEVDAITSLQVMELANQYFQKDGLSILEFKIK